MAHHPQLLFVAGPNGAGKSSFSKALSRPGAIIFDVDQVIPAIEANGKGLSKNQVYNAATDEFFLQAKQAVNKRLDFTLETNFRDEGLVNVVNQFKQFGYTTNMIYLTLDSIQRSVERVDQRVKNGGHHVHAKDILANYNQGLEFLERYVNQFDNVAVYDTSENIGRHKLLLSIELQRLAFVVNPVPSHISVPLANIVEFYNRGNYNLGR